MPEGHPLDAAVRSLPPQYRLVAWWRRVSPRRGAAFLTRAVGTGSAQLGLRTTAMVDVGPASICLDLVNTRHLVVLAEAAGEGHVAAAFRRLLGPGDTFLDVGSNGGGYVAFCAGIVGRDGRIVAVEPQPRLAAAIERTIAANATPGVVHQAAVGDAPGRLPLRVPKHNSGAASLHEREGARVEVEVTTLDDLITEPLPGTVVMKLDVEGHETAALAGAHALLARVRPIIVLELAPTLLRRAGTEPADLIAFLGERGYVFAEIDGTAATAVPAADLDAESQRDLIAFPTLSGLRYRANRWV